MDHIDIGKISKALADATRLRIFEEISARDQISCGEIVSIQGVTPATVSHHLRILSEAGLIVCRRKGQFIFSYAVPETIAAYVQAVAKVARLRTNRRQSTFVPIADGAWCSPMSRRFSSLRFGSRSEYRE